ncbi:hypothetical protein KL86PLE_30399 [uncultured Pleomorphomonas sp.]|uniref:Uncharacterized protein n=1 Tax=uncultured Pleomorphomonas sp. TaxID=442121 RepID=A0A212LEF2_9HYPH|nr:hypothetical protein KL86PLE_30399 [uncultured Pleomorphomonas sp.]
MNADPRHERTHGPRPEPTCPIAGVSPAVPIPVRRIAPSSGAHPHPFASPCIQAFADAILSVGTRPACATKCLKNYCESRNVR